MPQPNNYTLNLPDPAQSLMQAVRLGGGITQLQGQQDANALTQLKTDQALNMQKDLAAAAQDPTTASVAKLSVKYPALADHFKQSYAMLNQEQQKNRINQASQVYAALNAGDNQQAQTLLEQQAQAYDNSNMPQQAKAARDMAQVVKLHPNTAKTSAGLFLASAMGPDHFEKTFTGLQKDQENQANQWVPLKPAEAKQIIPGGTIPGTFLVRNQGTGDLKLEGKPAVVKGKGSFGGSQVLDLRNPQTGQQPSVDQPLPNQNAEALAQMIAHYKVMPSAYLLRSPAGQLMMARASKINPQYDSTNYPMIQQARKDFATGRAGQSIKSIAASVSHLNVLQNIAQGLNNGDNRTVNKAKQMFQREFGSPIPSNFDTARNIVAGEIVKSIIGNISSEADRKAAMEVLNKADSWPQLEGAISTIHKLMGGQLAAYRNQYKAATFGTNKDFDRILGDNKAALKALDSFSTQEGNNQPGQQDQPAQGQGQAQPSGDDINALVNKYTQGGGQ